MGETMRSEREEVGGGRGGRALSHKDCPHHSWLGRVHTLRQTGGLWKLATALDSSHKDTRAVVLFLHETELCQQSE